VEMGAKKQKVGTLKWACHMCTCQCNMLAVWHMRRLGKSCAQVLGIWKAEASLELSVSQCARP
jgi:hypothetical protein